MGQTVRLALPFFDWPREGHIDCCEPREGILFDSQLLTIKRNNPTKNAKHTKYCNQSRCIGSCPTKPYYFANAIVYNSTPNTVYLTPDSKLAVVEPQ